MWSKLRLNVETENRFHCFPSPSLISNSCSKSQSCTEALLFFLLCASQCNLARSCSKHHFSEHKKTSNSPDTPISQNSQIVALNTICLELWEWGHRQEMLAGLITNVFAAGACIVWLEAQASLTEKECPEVFQTVKDILRSQLHSSPSYQWVGASS